MLRGISDKITINYSVVYEERHDGEKIQGEGSGRLMRIDKRAVSEAALVFCGVFLAGSGTAHAYIDPGSGSYVLQVAIATLFGALFSVKVFWHKIKQFVSHLFAGGSSRKGDPSDAG